MAAEPKIATTTTIVTPDNRTITTQSTVALDPTLHDGVLDVSPFGVARRPPSTQVEAAKLAAAIRRINPTNSTAAIKNAVMALIEFLRDTQYTSTTILSGAPFTYILRSIGAEGRAVAFSAVIMVVAFIASGYDSGIFGSKKR